jgi:hypothetical protein
MFKKGYLPVIGLVIILFVILAIVGSEGFTSTGTIIQLQSSHVPTPAELNDMECLGGLYKCNYRNILFGFGA